MFRSSLTLLLLIALAAFPGTGRMEAAPVPAAEVKSALARAATFFHQEISRHGGYVYYVSPDLTRRLGEGEASPDQIWVQPPGTPTVGLAFLRAYEATDDPAYLRAATEAGQALLHGQLESGGWTNAVDFNPQGSRVAQYRNGKGRGRNFSTLDDGITQAALRLLMRLDQAHRFGHPGIHEGVETALQSLLAAQFDNGAFPQGWVGPVESPPVVSARYPEHDWKTEGRIKNYWDMYTLNDGVAGTVVATLMDAHEIYDDERYLEALKGLGDFLVRAQMPAPQPAWAQQYNQAMEPIWARPFEPAAIAGRESQDVIGALLQIAFRTRDVRYLRPIPPALTYLRKSALSGGDLARYYELRTNKPLYMSRRGKEYSLTYDDSNLPSHYGWKVASRVDELEASYRSLMNRKGLPDQALDTAALATEVRELLTGLDDQGRWLTAYQGEPLVGQPKFQSGEQYISSAVFSQNVATLCDYLERVDSSR